MKNTGLLGLVGRIVKVLFRVAILVPGICLLFSCAPVTSGVQIMKANIALSAAKTADADKTAPYEYTAAQEYLQKAREEAGYSDFYAARKYAEKAMDFAVRAKQRAQAAVKATLPASLPEPQVVVPE